MRVVPSPRRDGARLGAEIDAALNGELAGAEASALRELPRTCGRWRRLRTRSSSGCCRHTWRRWARERREASHAHRSGSAACAGGSDPRPGGRWRSAARGRCLPAPRDRRGAAGGGPSKTAEQVAPDDEPRGRPSERRRLPAGGSTDDTRGSVLGLSRSAASVLGRSRSVPRRDEREAPAARRIGDAGDRRRRSAGSRRRGVAPRHELRRIPRQLPRPGPQGRTSEAQMILSLPSAKLSQAIAALGRIAPERAVNQESQDITSSYEQAQRRLRDDEAVRRALLHALADATTRERSKVCATALRATARRSRATAKRSTSSLIARPRRSSK